MIVEPPKNAMEADEAGASDGASQLIRSVGWTRRGREGETN
jgi:hypothetical protein